MPAPIRIQVNIWPLGNRKDILFPMAFFQKRSNQKQASAIVLGGGAARGSYEIGVWKVLKEQGYKFNAFAGTSVGALNATLMAQGDYETASQLWDSISLSDVLILPPDLTPKDITTLSLKSIKALYQQVVHRGGLDSSPLLKLLRTHIREDLLRKKAVDLGLVTFAVPQLKPVKRFLNEMEHGRLVEYLYASASFPLFKAAKIDKQYFTDGGMNDNVPAGMMQDRGYRNLVVVDVTGVGIVHRPQMEHYSITYIKNSRPLPNIMDFHQSSLRLSREMGENDARRVLGLYEGIEYYFDLHKTRSQIYRRIEEESERFPREHIPDGARAHRLLPIAVFEAAGRAYGIPEDRPYSIQQFIDTIRSRDEAILRQIHSTGEDHMGAGSIAGVLMTIVKEKMGNRELLKSNPPMLWYLAAKELMPKQLAVVESALARLYPEIRIAETLREFIPGIPMT